MLPLFGVRRFGQPSSMVEPLPSGLINPMGLGGTPLNHACFNFTGSNYASIAALSTNLLGGGGNFTFSARHKPIAYNSVDQLSIVLYGGSNNICWIFSPRGNSQQFTIVFKTGGNLSSAIISAPSVPTDWCLVTVKYIASENVGYVYLNGSLIRTQPTTGSFASGTTTLNIGRFVTDIYNYSGKLADIRIYSTAVTPNHAIPATSESNLVAWYPYPNTSGVARDCSGNGNHMTTYGGTLYSLSGGPGLPWDWVLV